MQSPSFLGNDQHEKGSSQFENVNFTYTNDQILQLFTPMQVQNLAETSMPFQKADLSDLNTG